MASTAFLGSASGLVGSTFPAVIQIAAESGLVIDEVDASGFPSVTLTVGVPGGLAAVSESGDQFEVRENGVLRPSTVTELDDADELNVVVVFDRSGSMAIRQMQAAKAAALSFVFALPSEVSIGLVSFSTDATVDVPVTRDRESLVAAIEAIASNGRTSLYDAVVLAAALFDPAAERKVLVILSDGGDNDSVATLEEAVGAVSGLQVQMIELATPESNRAALDQLAAPLPVRSTDDPAELQALYTSVAQSLVGRVGISYESLAVPGSNTVVEVRLGAEALGRAASIEFTSPVPPTTVVATTLPAIDIVDPTPNDDQDLTAVRIISFILICSGLLLALRYATDRRIRPTRERLIPVGTTARGRVKPRELFGSTKKWLETNERQQELVAKIETLGLDKSAGSTILTTITLAIFMGIFGLLLQGLLLGLVFALVVLLIARSMLNSRVEKRRSEFIEQLPETLSMLSSMLRTGYGLVQALDSVAEEASEPTRSWIGQVIVEVRTGRDLIDSLRSLAVQIDSIDVDWVIAGIEISRDTGGDLAKTLDTVAETIRDRDKLRGQIKSLTAEGRMSAYVMLALPPGVGLLSYLINPDFSGVLLEPVGLVLLTITGLLMLLGYFWMKKLISKVTL